MKHKFLLLCLIVSLMASAKKTDVPKEVLSEFSKKYASVQKPKWKKSKTGEYVAYFKLQSQLVNATFSSTGSWNKTETTIPGEAAPVAILKSIRKKYPEEEINYLVKVENKGLPTIYQFVVIDDSTELELTFDEKGSLLKSQKKIPKKPIKIDNPGESENTINEEVPE